MKSNRNNRYNQNTNRVLSKYKIYNLYISHYIKINEIYFIITIWRLKLRFQCSKSQKYQIMNIIKETTNKNDDKTNPLNSHATL